MLDLLKITKSLVSSMDNWLFRRSKICQKVYKEFNYRNNFNMNDVLKLLKKNRNYENKLL